MHFSTDQFYKDISENRSTIMGLAIIAILLFHQRFMEAIPWNLFHYYGYWGVDIFLLLSGMGLVNSLQKYPIRIYYQRRLFRLFPSCLFCGILKCLAFILISTVIALPSHYSLINWLSPFSLDLWYIRALLIYYLLSPLLYKYLQNRTWLTIGGVVLLFLINDLFFRIHDSNSPTWIAERLLVFTIGMLLAVRKKILSCKAIILSIVFLIMAICIAGFYKGDIHSMSLPWTIMMFSLATGAVSLVYIIILLLKHIPQSILIPIKWIGSFSLELYLIHEFIFGIVALTTGNHLNCFWQLITSITLSLILAYICKWFTEKILFKLH